MHSSNRSRSKSSRTFRQAASATAITILLGSIAHADYFPLTLTPGSWTQDIVVENTAINFTPSVTATLDDGTTKNGFTWYETGLPGSPTGTGIGRSGSTFVSKAFSTTAFQYQPFNGNDAILLDGGLTSATMTLGQATPLTGLSFLTATGGGTGNISITINFADGTPALTSAATFTSPDWFGNTPIAVTAGGRVGNSGVNTFGFQNNGDNPRLYEAQVVLPALASQHPIASIGLTYGGSGHSGILAVSAAANELTWSGSTDAKWDINTTANWAGFTTYVDGSTVYFDDFGSNTDINIQAAGGVKPFAVSLKNNTSAYSFSGNAIAGNASVTLGGIGTVTINNVNTYTGGTVVNAGTLNVSSGATLGAATGSLAVNNLNTGIGTDVNVNLNSSQTVGSLASFIATPSGGTNTAKLNLLGASNTLTVNQATNTIFDGAITGAGGLLKTGNGTLSLKGSSTYTGGTVVSGGTLEVFNPTDDGKSVLPSGKPVTVNSGATLRMGEDDGLGYYATGASSLTLNGGTVLSKYEHHSTLPALTLNNGTVAAQGAGNVSNGVTANYILDGTVTTAGSLASTISAPKVLLRGNTTGEGGPTGPVTFQVPRGTAASDLVVSSSLADKGAGLIKNGNGILSLTGNSTYSGGTFVNQGTVAVSGVQGSGIATTSLGTGTVSLLGGTLALQGQTAATPGLTANFYQLGGVDQASFANLSAFQSHFAALTPTVGGVNTTTGGKADLNYGNGGGGNNAPFNVAGADTANYGFGGTANYEVSMQGYIAIPAAGTYTFGTTSDDGSVLFIDGNHDAVVVNNFFQGMTNRTGTYTFPAAGLYPIAAGFNQGGGGQGFQVLMALPGQNGQVVTNAQVFSSTGTLAATQWYANNVSVGVDSTVQVTNSLAASMGTLSIGANTLNVTGDTGASLAFRSTNLTGNAVLNAAAGTTVKSGAVSDDFATSAVARSLTKSGNGSLVLSGIGTYGGGTTINAGTVTVGHANALGSGTVTLNGGTIALTSAAGTVGFTGYTLNSNGALPTLNGTNDTLFLTDENGGGQARSSFSPNLVSIANGFTANFVYQAGGNRAADGIAFTIQNSATGSAALGGAGGGLGYQGITNSGALEFNLYTGGGNPVGTALGAGGAAPSGYTGTPSVNFSNGNPIGVKVVYDNTAKTLTETLTDLVSNSVYTQVFTGADLVAALGGGTSGYIGFTGGTGGATATQQISGYEFNNYSQGITLANNVNVTNGASAGFQVLPISAGGAGAATVQGHLTLGSGSTLSVTGGATSTNTAYGFNVTGVTTLGGNATVSVTNNGTGAGVATLTNVDQTATAGLTKAGNGTLVLSGAATYTGGTTVSTGTLLVNGTLGSSTLAAQVANGATLGGAGTVNPAVSVSGIIAPGSSLNGIGKLTLGSTNTTAALDLSGGGTYLWELGALLDNALGTAGTDFDQLFLAGSGGNLRLGGTSKLTVGFDNGIATPNSSDPFWTANHSWTIVLGGAGVTNTGTTNFGSITDATFTSGTFSTAADASGKVTLTYLAVPEPATCATLAGGLALLLLPRRRRS